MHTYSSLGLDNFKELVGLGFQERLLALFRDGLAGKLLDEGIETLGKEANVLIVSLELAEVIRLVTMRHAVLGLVVDESLVASFETAAVLAHGVSIVTVAFPDVATEFLALDRVATVIGESTVVVELVVNESLVAGFETAAVLAHGVSIVTVALPDVATEFLALDRVATVIGENTVVVGLIVNESLVGGFAESAEVAVASVEGMVEFAFNPLQFVVVTGVARKLGFVVREGDNRILLRLDTNSEAGQHGEGDGRDEELHDRIDEGAKGTFESGWIVICESKTAGKF